AGHGAHAAGAGRRYPGHASQRGGGTVPRGRAGGLPGDQRRRRLARASDAGAARPVHAARAAGRRRGAANRDRGRHPAQPRGAVGRVGLHADGRERRAVRAADAAADGRAAVAGRGGVRPGPGAQGRGRGDGAAAAARAAARGAAAQPAGVRAAVRPDARAAGAGVSGGGGDAPGADERGGGDHAGGGVRGAVGDRRAGDERRGDPHGAAVPAGRRCRVSATLLDGRAPLAPAVAAPAAPLLIVGGRVIDPASGLDRVADVRLRDGRIAAIAPGLAPEGGETVLEARGRLVLPGFVDLHCHLGEPGHEDRETLASGTRAAAAGGFTTVCCMGDTAPRLDTGAELAALRSRAEETALVRVLPIGCVTRGRDGTELAELAELAEAGAVAFSDDPRPVRSSRLLRHALAYSAMLGRPVVEHAVDPDLAEGGLAHEGRVATWLGLPGVPAAAEEIAVARAIALARLTGGRLHLAHLSTAGAVAQVRAARAEGLAVTAEVSPLHLLLDEESVGSGPGGRPYDTSTRLDPPLRSAADAAALRGGLADGTLAAIATDHRPQRAVDKDCEYA